MYNADDITKGDYTFVEGDNQEFWVIKLLAGKYADTMYHYGSVRIVPPEGGWTETEEDNIGTLSFKYSLMESPHDLDELNVSEDFNNYIGAVLQHIIEDSFQTGDYRIGGKDGESGNDNTEELNQ